MDDKLSTFVSDVLEEYLDGRINTSYLMIDYLKRIKAKAIEAGV